MGIIDSLKPFRIFSISTQSNHKHQKPSPCLKDQDSPSQWSSPLTLLTSLARRRLPELNASSNFGHTLRRITSKTQKTNNSSPQTKRWQRFSVTTASAPSAWPNSFHPTFLVKLWLDTRVGSRKLCSAVYSLSLNVMPFIFSTPIFFNQRGYILHWRFYRKTTTKFNVIYFIRWKKGESLFIVFNFNSFSIGPTACNTS